MLCPSFFETDVNHGGRKHDKEMAKNYTQNQIQSLWDSIISEYGNYFFINCHNHYFILELFKGGSREENILGNKVSYSYWPLLYTLLESWKKWQKYIFLEMSSCKNQSQYQINTAFLLVDIQVLIDFYEVTFREKDTPSPCIMRFPLAQFPLMRILAYVRSSGRILH